MLIDLAHKIIWFLIYEFWIRNGLGRYARFYESIKKFSFPIAPIESVTDFG